MDKKNDQVAKKTNDDSDDDFDYVPTGLTEQEFEDNLEYLKNHPMFLKEMPKEGLQSETIQAMAAIAYDEDDPRKEAERMNVISFDLSHSLESGKPNDLERK
jgi:hypothetical protein